MTKTILRRDFLKLSGMAAALAALAACRPINQALRSGPNLPTAQPTLSGDLLLSRALRRILFAPTPADLARARQIGLDAFIEEQLAPDSLPDPDVAAHLAAYDTLALSPVQLAQVTPLQKPGLQLIEATLARAVYSRRQLNELMVDFWSNHFNIYLNKTTDRYLKTIDDRKVIRPRALGKFSDLLSASAHSPAMLVYLDNALSNKTAPNENYGRELLELHTISVDGGYTQTDVHEAARALTGWTVYGPKGKDPGTFVFNPRIHDDGDKTILGVHFPAGQGMKDGEQLLSLLAEHPSTAGFLSAKLARRFVADDPPAALLARATTTFTQTGGDIAKVLGTILHSDEFKASLLQKVKRPLEYVVSALRVTGADVRPDLPTVNALRGLGQQPFGWQSPNGYPDSAGAWVSTNGVLRRWNYALALAFNALKDTHIDYAGLLPAPSSTAAGIDALALRLLGEPLPPNERQILLDFAGTGDFEKLAPALTALILCTVDFQYR
jgi:uncharacterized protein (DUF1800 family)